MKLEFRYVHLKEEITVLMILQESYLKRYIRFVEGKMIFQEKELNLQFLREPLE